jgi:hypothetical protein
MNRNLCLYDTISFRVHQEGATNNGGDHK